VSTSPCALTDDDAAKNKAKIKAIPSKKTNLGAMRLPGALLLS
jgi:hypothetical protein